LKITDPKDTGLHFPTKKEDIGEDVNKKSRGKKLILKPVRGELTIESVIAGIIRSLGPLEHKGPEKKKRLGRLQVGKRQKGDALRKQNNTQQNL